MSFEFNPNELSDLNERARANPITHDTPPGFFDGTPKAIGLGVMRGGARTAKGIGILGATVPIAIDRELGTDLTSRYFGALEKATDPAIEYWTPQPYEIGTAGKVLGGLSEITLPLMLGGGNPSLLMAGTTGATSADLVKQGVDARTAVSIGTAEAGATGLGFKIPFFGSTLAQKMAFGAGSNLALGIGTSGFAHGKLEAAGYDKQAEAYDPWNLEARAIDILTGLVFGGIAHLSTRAGPMDIPPEQRDALLTAANVKHLDADTAPGRPVSDDAALAHAEAMRTTIDQITRGEPVQVPESVKNSDFAETPEQRAYREDIARQITEERVILDDMLGRERVMNTIMLSPAEMPTVGPMIEHMRATYGEESIGKFAELIHTAEKVKPHFDALLKDAANESGTQVYLADVKGKESALKKILHDYQGDPSKVKDMVRATMVVDNVADIPTAIESVKRRFQVLDKGFRNLWVDGMDPADGYRDVKMNVLIDGHVSEIQINTPEMLDVKGWPGQPDGPGHVLYKEAEAIRQKAISENRKETPEEIAAIIANKAEAKRLYDAAYSMSISRKRASDTGAPSRSAREPLNLRTEPSGSNAQAVNSGSTATGKPSTSQYVQPLGRSSTDLGASSISISSKPIIAGKDGKVITERGDEVETQWAVVDAQDLITSHDRNLRPRQDYPQELQPRDRSRAASEAQITKIENGIRPELLGDSPKASDGAPIIGPDGVVESGNARTIALSRAYVSGRAGKYLEWLKANLDKFGLPDGAVNGMNHPVLVRVRKTNVNRAEFARQANESAVAGYSPVEMAMQDARRLSSIDGLVVNEDGTINGRASMDFIRRFITETVAEAERPMMMDRDGRLSQQGLLRLKNAIFAKAYGDPDLIGMLAESTDANIRNILAGMMRVAPDVARLREMIDAGARHPMDFSADLSRAAREFSRLRSEGMSVEQFLAQSDMFGNGITPEVSALLAGLQDNARAPKRVAAMLGQMVESIDRLGDPRQMDLMGSGDAPRAADLIARSVEDMRAEMDAAPGEDLFKSPEVDAARQTVESNPELRVADEITGEAVSARVALDRADMDIELAKRDAPVFDALANCLIGH